MVSLARSCQTPERERETEREREREKERERRRVLFKSRLVWIKADMQDCSTTDLMKGVCVWVGGWCRVIFMSNPTLVMLS